MSFNKLPLENLIEFCLRMAEKKKTDKSITWQGIADSLPANFNVVKSEVKTEIVFCIFDSAVLNNSFII